MTAFAPPTDDVARLVEIIGPEAAMRLIEARGGTRVYLSDAGEGRTVSDIVGVDAAAKLNAIYGRDKFKVPLARDWRVLCYRQQGLSYRQMALRVGCSENGVGNILRRYQKTQVQFDLFKPLEA